MESKSESKLKYFEEAFNPFARHTDEEWLALEKEWVEFREDPKTAEIARQYEKENWITFESLYMVIDRIGYGDD